MNSKRKRYHIEDDKFERLVKLKKNYELVERATEVPKFIAIFIKDKHSQISTPKFLTSKINTTQPPNKSTNNEFQRPILLNRLLNQEKLLKSLPIKRSVTKTITDNDKISALIAKRKELYAEVVNQFEKSHKIFDDLTNSQTLLNTYKDVEKDLRTNFKELIVYRSQIGLNIKNRLNDVYDMVHGMQNDLYIIRTKYQEKKHKIKELQERLADHIKENELICKKIEMSKIRIDEKKKHAVDIDNQITVFKENLAEKSTKIIQLNKEFYQEYLRARILNEQIHAMKLGPRSICLFLPKSNLKNAFNYEHYVKTTKKTVTFINDEKMLNWNMNNKDTGRLSVSPLKKDFIRSTNQFTIDQYKTRMSNTPTKARKSLTKVMQIHHMKYDIIITANNHNLGFYNYDVNKKLYADIELYLKILLYKQYDSILTKISFDRPEFDRILCCNSKLDNNIKMIPDIITKMDDESTRLPINHYPNISRMNAFFSQGKLSQNDSKSQGLILILGDKERNGVLNLILHIWDEFQIFKNEVITVISLKLKFEIQEKDPNSNNLPHEVVITCETKQDFIVIYNKTLKSILFNKTLIVLTLSVEIENMMAYNNTNGIHEFNSDTKFGNENHCGGVGTQMKIPNMNQMEEVKLINDNNKNCIGENESGYSNMNGNSIGFGVGVGKNYIKRINFIFIDVDIIDNVDIFARQFKAIINKEKIWTTKDKIVEKLENMIKGIERYMIIGMIPNLIKLNQRTTLKYTKIKILLDLISKLSR